LIFVEALMDTPAPQEAGALPNRAHLYTPLAAEPIAVGLSAAMVAVRGHEPMVAIVPAGRPERPGDGALPCGLFSPRQHGGIEAGVRFWVQQQTGIELGAARQICTLGARFAKNGGAETPELPVVAVCYLALIGPQQLGDGNGGGVGAAWQSWYAYFPWEDWRRDKPACLTQDLEPRLMAWARMTPAHCEVGAPRDALDRSQRVRIAFGLDGVAWDEEKVLERYELLAEAGLVGEAASGLDARWPRLWHSTFGDHARVLASAIGEVRRSVKCRPAIFELMPDVFTLFELQKTAEAILGPHLHKQNFRRLVEGGGLVEPTGEYRFRTGGRPAQLYRFRPDVLLERLAPGVRIKAGRS
jgi:hypothetical protein